VDDSGCQNNAWLFAARVKLHMAGTEKLPNIQRPTTNVELPIRIRFAQTLMKIDRIHYSMLDVQRSMLTVRRRRIQCSLVSFSIMLDVCGRQGRWM